MENNNLSFIKSVPKLINYFDEEEQFIIELVGIDNFLTLYQRYSKTGFYFSSASILKLKKAWCIQNSHLTANELARACDVSSKSVYRWLNEND